MPEGFFERFQRFPIPRQVGQQQSIFGQGLCIVGSQAEVRTEMAQRFLEIQLPFRLPGLLEKSPTWRRT